MDNLSPVAEDEIDARIRELRRDPRWRELYDDASQTLLREFIRYDMENPQLYRLLYRFAEEAWASGGRPPFSIDRIYNRARWYALVETDGDDFTLNQNYRSLYGRRLIYEHPDKFGNGFLEMAGLRRFAHQEK